MGEVWRSMYNSANMPRRKEPIMFIISVDHGKPSAQGWELTPLPSKKRPTPPTAHPSATKNICKAISEFLNLDQLHMVKLVLLHNKDRLLAKGIIPLEVFLFSHSGACWQITTIPDHLVGMFPTQHGNATSPKGKVFALDGW